MSASTWRADTGRQDVPRPRSPPPAAPTCIIMPTAPIFLTPGPAVLVPAPNMLALPPPGMFFLQPPPPFAPATVAPAAPKSETRKRATPGQTPGMKYIYPRHHTCLHVIKDVKVWEGTDGNFLCKVFNVGTSKTVGELVEDLLGKGDGEEGCAGWAVTEVIELGDGVFGKDVTVEYGSDDAGKTLADMGWNQARGSARPPVWLVLHETD